MHFIVLSFIVLLSVLFPSSAKAQLFLEEGKIVLAVTGGERINKTITAANTSAQDIHFKIYWEDFQYKPPFDGSKKFFPAGVGPASASQWVSFSPQEATVPAYGKIKINYSVNVPPSIEKGHYGVLFFEQVGGPSLKNNTGVDIVVRVGSLFFIEPKGASKKVSLENMVSEGSKITGDFVNESQVTLIPRMLYYIMEEGGMVKDRGELKKIYVPAAATAAWEMPIPSSLNQGHYTIVMNIDLGEENVLTKEISLGIDGSGQASIEGTRN